MNYKENAMSRTMLHRLTPIFLFLVAVFTSLSPQPALAGGGGGTLTSLSFPAATSASCGMWQVTGDFDLSSGSMSLTDGLGNVLMDYNLSNFHASGIVAHGYFSAQVKPLKNPITFSIGFGTLLFNISGDNPCLPPSTNTAALPSRTPGTSRLVFASQRQEMLYAISTTGGTPQPFLQMRIPGGSISSPTWSPDGKQLAFMVEGSKANQLFTADQNGNYVQQRTYSPNQKHGIVWSPDSTRLVFSQSVFPEPRPDGLDVLYMINADGTNLHRLTANAANEVAPTWSPDGKKIAFWSVVNNKSDLYLINANGTGQHLIASNARPLGSVSDSSFLLLDVSEAQWSSNGQKLLLNGFYTDPNLTPIAKGQGSGGTGHPEIIEINSNGSGLQRLTNGTTDSFMPVWSPDGRHIAYLHGEINPDGFIATVYVMNPDGTQPMQISDRNIAIGIDSGFTAPAWTSDSQHVIYSAFLPNSYDQWTVMLAALDGTTPVDLTTPDMAASEPALQP